MSADDKPCQATPSADLRQQIMDSRVPKNEREWWASRTIEKLERERDQLRAEVDALKQCIESGPRVLREDADRNAARAERAEAELAFQVARNSDLFTQRDEAVKAQGEAEAELASERARLDWIMSGRVVLVPNGSGHYVSRLHYPVSRAAIDGAMKEGA